MKRLNLKRNFTLALLVGGPIVATTALAQSQGGYSMGFGGMMGVWMGGGGNVGFILLASFVVVVAGVLARIVAQKEK